MQPGMGIFFPFTRLEKPDPASYKEFFSDPALLPSFFLDMALIISIFHATKQTTAFVFLTKQAFQKK
ncbi:MAG: hypothetical protein WCT30_09610 [Desulfurivibrionaceae bacterium]|jgi:hypothetical protein